MNGEDEAVCSGDIIECHGFRPVIRRPPPAVVHFDGHGGLLIKEVSPELVALEKVSEGPDNCLLVCPLLCLSVSIHTLQESLSFLFVCVCRFLFTLCLSSLFVCACQFLFTLCLSSLFVCVCQFLFTLCLYSLFVCACQFLFTLCLSSLFVCACQFLFIHCSSVF